MNTPDVIGQPTAPTPVACSAWLEVLAQAFGEVSKQRRDLEDACVHDKDRQRARMRSCICMDIQAALRIAAKSTSNIQADRP